MNRMTALLLAAVLCLSVTACSKKAVPEEPPQEIPQETSHEIRITVTNTVTESVAGLGVTWYLGDQPFRSTGMQAPDGKGSGSNTAEFVLNREDIPRDADLDEFGVRFMVRENSGVEFDICTLYFPAEFGENYAFEVRHEDGCYGVWAESDGSIHSGSTTATPEETAPQSIELVGPWHLDSEKNDLAAFADRFPGYAEWGASMEIRSSGLMSWYIGAEGWHGNYVMDEETLHAELGSDLEQIVLPWDFRIVTENEPAMLEMDYADMTVYWIYGDQEDIPAMGRSPKVYVDRQGTDDVYSSLSITQENNDYTVEMEIHRLGGFRGTAVKTQGMLFYTDDDVGIKGTIQYDVDHAVFEVTESSWNLVQAGETWVFPEVIEESDAYGD